MHASSLENMQKCYERYVCGEYLQSKNTLRVLDVGGANVNGSYADIFSQDKFRYLAADISPAEGVDVVLTDPYRLPFDNSSIDIVISGQAFEHVEFFWLLFEEMVRIVKNDGWIFLISPSAGPSHRFPVDCYRFYPDAYRALAKYTGIQLIDIFHDPRGPWQDLVGVFSKTKKITAADFSKWKTFADSEINRFTVERLPVSTVVERRSEELEKIAGNVSYLEILRLLHQKLEPSNYVEIGVRKGTSLSLAQCPTIAIDPEPDIDLSNFNKVTLYTMSSDHFFEYHTAVLEQHPIDFAFIDGMHLFEFVLRDFINIEAHSCCNTVVVIDDIFPNHVLQASRKRVTQVWTGDVWKIIPCLQEYRPDLNLMMLDSFPTGLLIISGLTKQNKTLANQYNPIVRKFNQFSLADNQQLIIKRKEAIALNDFIFEQFLNSILKAETKYTVNPDSQTHLKLL